MVLNVVSVFWLKATSFCLRRDNSDKQMFPDKRVQPWTDHCHVCLRQSTQTVISTRLFQINNFHSLFATNDTKSYFNCHYSKFFIVFPVVSLFSDFIGFIYYYSKLQSNVFSFSFALYQISIKWNSTSENYLRPFSPINRVCFWRFG